MEQRLIDANAAREEVLQLSSHVLCEWDSMGVLMMLDRQKPVDAVPVVRCGECEHWQSANCPMYYEDRPSYRDSWHCKEDWFLQLRRTPNTTRRITLNDYNANVVNRII